MNKDRRLPHGIRRAMEVSQHGAVYENTSDLSPCGLTFSDGGPPAGPDAHAAKSARIAVPREGQDGAFSFDTLWHSEGRLTREVFAARLAIPFKSLRFTNAPVQTWGIALVRVISPNNETPFWPPISRRVEGFTQQCATLEG